MDIVSKINGNQVSATEFNQMPTELEALITSSGQTVSDAILNQDSIAVARYSANNFYIDSGAANAYILTLAASMTNPVSATVGYFTGMTIRFRAGNANSGASTVNVNSAGVKDLKQADGTTALAAGDIPTTQDSVFRYNGTAFCLSSASASVTSAFGNWQSWTPTFTGFSVNPTVIASYLKVGKICFLQIDTSVAGTSNATGFTITNLPFTAAIAAGNCVAPVNVVNNGTAATGFLVISQNSTTASIFPTASTSSLFTASGIKYVSFCIAYQTAT